MDDESEPQLWEELTRTIYKERGAAQGEMENQLLSGSFFYSLQYPDARRHVPTNKREKAAKKLRCTVRQRSRQLGSLQDLCSHARCQRHSNHLSILDLSLGGYIGLILRAGVFRHVAYEICRRLRRDTAAHTETGKSTA